MDSTMFSLNSFSRSYSPDLFLQRAVKPGILDGNADITGEGHEQFQSSLERKSPFSVRLTPR